MTRESSAEIDAAAARWAARADRGLNAAEERDLAEWLAADRRRVGAYARAHAVLAHAERARGLGPEFAVPAQSRWTRRRVLSGGVLAAGVAAVAVLTGALWLNTQALRTDKGEVRLVPLPDGSSVTLNTDSAVRVGYRDALREIELVSGEALFDVAKDAHRPFVVRAGRTSVRAVGTSFTVRRMPDGGVRVVVREGVVQIEDASQRAMPTRAPANVAVLATPAGTLAATPVAPSEVTRELAWREGMVAFDGVTVAQAVAELERYNDTRIVVDDPALGRETITGLFSASDPRGFAKAIASSFNATVTPVDGTLHLSR
jgi:transmembrane sensor